MVETWQVSWPQAQFYAVLTTKILGIGEYALLSAEDCIEFWTYAHIEPP